MQLLTLKKHDMGSMSIQEELNVLYSPDYEIMVYHSAAIQSVLKSGGHDKSSSLITHHDANQRYSVKKKNHFPALEEHVFNSHHVWTEDMVEHLKAKGPSKRIYSA